MRNWMLGALAAVAVAAAVALAVGRSPGEPRLHGTWLGEGIEHAPVTLLDAEGRPTTLRPFLGSPTLLFFGFTSCPDVCPTTLMKLADAVRLSGDASSDARVVFVSVDPGRDTPADADAYAKRFHPGFTGLGGTPEQIEAATAEYGILAQTQAPDASAAGHAGHGEAGGGDYVVVHTPHVLALDANGRLRALWGSDVTAEQLAEDLRALAAL